MPDYNTQLPTQGGFVAKDTISRIAERRARRAKESRDAQIKLQEDAEKAIENAQKLMDNDFSKMNEHVVGAAWKVFDAYKDDYYNAVTALEANPTAENRKRLNDVAMNYQSIINDIQTTGSMITNISGQEWDSAMSAEGVNSMSDFIGNIGNYVAKMDGHTGLIDGQSVSRLFQNTVKTDKFVKPIDTATMSTSWYDGIMDGRFEQRTRLEGGMEVTEKVISFGEDAEQKSWKSFNDIYSAKGKEKEKFLLTEKYFSDLETEGVSDLEGYGEVVKGADGKDRFVMTDRQLYEYKVETEIRPNLTQFVKSEPQKEDEGTVSERKEADNVSAAVETITKQLNGDRSVGRTFSTDEFQAISGQPARPVWSGMINTSEGEKIQIAGLTSEGIYVTEEYDKMSEEGWNKLALSLYGKNVSPGERKKIINELKKKDFNAVDDYESYGWVANKHMYGMVRALDTYGSDVESPKKAERNKIFDEIKKLGVPVEKSWSKGLVIGDGDDAISVNVGDVSNMESFEKFRRDVSIAIWNYKSNKEKEVVNKPDVIQGGVTFTWDSKQNKYVQK